MVLRIIGLALLAGGIVFLILGLNATETTGETLRKEFAGQYSDETTWYIILGVVGIVVGGALAIFGPRLGKKGP
ncbi:MAG: DUF3185 family protein [Planctomycetaceae bacterium]|nr:DUF3185 family protein [Planctomycetaceae bacterium]